MASTGRPKFRFFCAFASQIIAQNKLHFVRRLALRYVFLISVPLISIYGVSMMLGKSIKNVFMVVFCFTISGIMFYCFSGYAAYFDESAMRSVHGFSVLKQSLSGNEFNAALEVMAYFVLSSMLVFGVNLAYIKFSVSRKIT